MISILKNKATIVAFLTILISSIFYSYEFRVKDNAWQQIVNSDGRGYYGYLPAAFIYHDWDWRFVYEQERLIIKDNPNYIGDYLNEIDGEKVNRYFVGTAVLMAPFFALGYIYSTISGAPVDGYSLPFFISILISTLFYFMLGINYMRKTLLLYGFSNLTTAIVLLAFGLGSNLFYYANFETSMSHVYSFVLVAAFCYYSKKISLQYSNKTLLGLITIFSLIVLSRPVNGLVLLVLPFFFTSHILFLDFCKKVFSNYKVVFFSLIIASLVLSLQVLAYYMQTGKYWVYAYNDAKFNFNDPYFFQILFGFRKGLFIYAPITFFSILGLIFLFKKNIYQAIVWLLFFLITNYVLSSWSFWTYGGCFGLRAYIEFYPLFMILLALAINGLNFYKYIMLIIVPLCIFLNFIQMYQYQNYILHWDAMTKESYWRVFLKTDNMYRGVLWQKPLSSSLNNYKGYVLFENTNSMDSFDENWSTNNSIVEFENAHSGNKVSKVGPNQFYSEVFVHKIKDISSQEMVLKVSSWFYLIGKKSRPSIVISIDNGSNSKLWDTYFTYSIFEDTQLNKWLNHSLNYKLSNLEQNDIIKIYYTNSGESDSYIDDIKVTFEEGEMFYRRPCSTEHFINKINENPEWIELIKQKSLTLNISVEEMLLRDAKYMSEEDKKIVNIEHQILKDQNMFNKVKLGAIDENKSVQKALYEKAIAIYNKQ
jgi:hypothetical protein